MVFENNNVGRDDGWRERKKKELENKSRTRMGRKDPYQAVRS